MKKSILLCLFLSGCISQEEIARQQQEMAQELNAYEVQQCTELGFKPKTNSFGECRLRLRQMVLEARGRAVSNAIAAQSNYNANRPRTCNSFGGTTTCY